MKDRENVLRQLDETDNMIMVIDQAVKMAAEAESCEQRGCGMWKRVLLVGRQALNCMCLTGSAVFARDIRQGHNVLLQGTSRPSSVFSNHGTLPV